MLSGPEHEQLAAELRERSVTVLDLVIVAGILAADDESQLLQLGQLVSGLPGAALQHDGQEA